MFALDRYSLRTRLLASGVVLTAVPLAITLACSVSQARRMETISGDECRALATEEVDRVATALYHVAETQETLSERLLSSHLAVASRLLAEGGPLESSEKVSWEAVNQYSHESVQVLVPRLRLAGSPMEIVRDPKTPVRVVDQVKAILGSQCTIFQRMNAQGDMIRTATTIVDDKGRRAIGTYIPVRQPDGTPTAVLAKVLNGERFVGRALVVNSNYVAAYEPIRDPKGTVTGMLFVGVPDEGLKKLRETIAGTKVGKTGYAYVIDSAGRYVVSNGGKRDGEVILNSKDTDGKFFIRILLEQATRLKPGETTEVRYPWINPGESAPRLKLVRATYFAPADWVIGVGAYEDEIFEAGARMSAIARRDGLVAIGVALVSVLASIGVWWLTAQSLSGRILRQVRQLGDGTSQVVSASNQVSSSAQTLSQGATEQAAALEETSASMEEMASMTRQNADNCRQAAVLVNEVSASVESFDRTLGGMVTAMGRIRDTSGKVSKIIKTIDEISFQTNILALNAAVEAARAGEAGLGFAVVAEEVRNLAQRAAQAARDTATLIEESTSSACDGSEKVEQMAAASSGITTTIVEVKHLVDQVSSASIQQAQGIEQVSQAISQMEQVTQSNAASAEESAAASEELNAQAETARHLVAAVEAVIEGAATGSSPAVHAGAEPSRSPAVISMIGSTRRTRPAPVRNGPSAGEQRTGTFGRIGVS
jgi:methyl-accepting chemotaxis protein